MEFLAAWGVKLSFQVNFLSERRMLNQLKGLISILLGSVQHLFVKAISTFWARFA